MIYKTPACADCGTVRTYAKAPAVKDGPPTRCRPCTNRRLATVSVGLAAQVVREQQAYVDEINVERLLAGFPVPNATRAERTAATAILTAKRLAATEIAHRLGCAQRTVERYRKALAA